MNQYVIDMLIVFTGWLIGNIIFNKFEKHLGLVKRLTKLVIMLIILLLIDYFAERIALFSVLGLMIIGMCILHGYWFPKHEINGLTAGPYEKYLKLINKKRK